MGRIFCENISSFILSIMDILFRFFSSRSRPANTFRALRSPSRIFAFQWFRLLTLAGDLLVFKKLIR